MEQINIFLQLIQASACSIRPIRSYTSTNSSTGRCQAAMTSSSFAVQPRIQFELSRFPEKRI